MNNYSMNEQPLIAKRKSCSVLVATRGQRLITLRPECFPVNSLIETLCKLFLEDVSLKSAVEASMCSRALWQTPDLQGHPVQRIINLVTWFYLRPGLPQGTLYLMRWRLVEPAWWGFSDHCFPWKLFIKMSMECCSIKCANDGNLQMRCSPLMKSFLIWYIQRMNENCNTVSFFSCDLAALQMVFSVCPFVRLSVRLF